MERLGATALRQALDRLTGFIRLRWREAAVAASVAIVAAAATAFAALQLAHLTRAADTLAQSRMSGGEGLPDVMESRCLDRSEGRP